MPEMSEYGLPDYVPVRVDTESEARRAIRIAKEEYSKASIDIVKKALKQASTKDALARLNEVLRSLKTLYE